ncbi:MAG: Ig-like domain-containing protein [Candidatus Latescibacterota bacterium]|nr:MAG: Ig-like domain-containing protein [Candidatus Latescibacterota bacterium]
MVTSIIGVDAYHVEVTFDEALNKPSAERTDNYTIVEKAPSPTATPQTDKESVTDAPRSASPGDTAWVATVVLQPGDKKVMITTHEAMSDVPYDIYIKGIRDVHGNQLAGTSAGTFTGSSDPDLTPPEIVAREPGPGATGVGTSQSFIVHFSEPMDFSSVYDAFSWTNGGGNVPFTMDQDHANEFVFTPIQSLELNTNYTVAFSSAAYDWAGNPLAPTSWSFRTTTVPDVTPPTLVSSIPVDGATNVSTESVLRLTFSEPIDPQSLDEDGVMIAPSPGDGIPEWSNGGRTISFEPFEPLMDDTQYLMVIPQGEVRDLAGNGMEESVTIQFTTGSSLAIGRISGTVTGDPYSTQADDPTGAIVLAPTTTPFDNGEYIEIYGAAFVETDDTYMIEHLPDNWYFPFAIMDSNGDGELDPERGDAIGAYGIDIRMYDFDYDSVLIDNGNTVYDVNIPLIDAEAISGTVVYVGDLHTELLSSVPFFVGAFDTATFDTTGGFPEPDFGTDGGPITFYPDWAIGMFDGGLMPGTYWVGAFMDVNYNSDFDPDTDPFGIYMNTQTEEWIPVTVENGVDAFGIEIYLDDPNGGLATRSSSWRQSDKTKPESAEKLRRLRTWMKRALEAHGIKDRRG